MATGVSTERNYREVSAVKWLCILIFALIIDDEVQIRRLLRVVLESENYKVHEAETGQQGLMEIATRKPDVVLLDLGLPDLDGLQVLKRLREWSEVPVIVLTVRDDVQEKVAALDAGADDYITKPFTLRNCLHASAPRNARQGHPKRCQYLVMGSGRRSHGACGHPRRP